jgi:hypothetical protein
MSSQFKILCQDSLQWLKNQKSESVANFITGLPDLDELSETTSMEQYIDFFQKVVMEMFRVVRSDGYCIFIQTDRKYEGQLIDKSFLITEVATTCGSKLVWHKIVCRRDVGKADLFRPTYSHFLCYTQSGKPGKAFPDVFAVGETLYDNGTPINVADAAAEFVSAQRKNQTQISEFAVVDPFVGRGTIGQSCLGQNLDFLGIDIDNEQCQLAREGLEDLAIELSN